MNTTAVERKLSGKPMPAADALHMYNTCNDRYHNPSIREMENLLSPRGKR